MQNISPTVTPEIIDRFLSVLEVPRTTPKGHLRNDEAVALSCLRQFGNLLTKTGHLDGVHYENDPLLLFLVRPPDVAVCVQTSNRDGSGVAVTISRTDTNRSVRQVEVDADLLPGSLTPVCILLAELAAELRSELPAN